MDDVSYDERRHTVALLERLAAQARLDLLREGNLIRAPVMEASAEGVLISEVLGIFLFLFLLLGMVVFFHKETSCATDVRHRLQRLLRGLRRRLCRFDREWNCEEDSSSSNTSLTGVYRDIASQDDVAGETQKAAAEEEVFDHRTALLELFADLELHREVVRHSLRGYSAALSRLNGPPAGQKAAPLRGILRAPSDASGHGRHKHGHHGHHGHRHRHAQQGSDVTAEADGHAQPGSDVTAETDGHKQPGSDITAETDRDTQPGSDVTTETDQDTQPRNDVTAEIDQDSQPGNDVTTEADGHTQSGSDVTNETDGHMQPESDVTTETDGLTQSGSDVINETDEHMQPGSDVTNETDEHMQPGSDITTETTIGDVTAPHAEDDSQSWGDVTLQVDGDVTSGQSGSRMSERGAYVVLEMAGDSTARENTASSQGGDVIPEQAGDVTLRQVKAVAVETCVDVSLC